MADQGSASHPRNILLLSTASNGGNASSYVDHIACFAKHSRHRFFYHNFVYNLHDDFDFSPFDAIVIEHNFWPELMGEQRRERLKRARAVKVLFLQDEYQYVRPINGYMAEMGINLMFTCVAPGDFDLFYPKASIASLREVHGALTGFVPDYLLSPALRKPSRRIYDVGYRSRVSPYFLGSTGREKQVIADRFAAICRENGLSANISVSEDDRIYGSSWLRFLRSCRTQLGTPSGSSIVDFDGSIIEQEAEYRASHPHATYEEVFDTFLRPHDGKHVIDTVSPRYFEYAATGTAMVLHEGFYGGILEPDRHYIPVRKDYSNADEVVAKIRDAAYCRELADRAYSELIASGRYSYRSFVARFDDILERHFPNPPTGVILDRKAFYEQQAVRHDQALAFDEKGPYLMNTPLGRRLRLARWSGRSLEYLPILGRTLRRVGGDPWRKVRLAAAAMRFARAGRASRGILYHALSRLVRGNDRTPERLLKDLLLLGIVKSAQSGRISWGDAYRVGLEHDKLNGRLILAGARTDAADAAQDGRFRAWADDDRSVRWTEIEEGFRTGRISSLLLDLSAVYPLRKFGNATLFFCQVGGRLELFRSAPDEFFHLDGLLGLSARQPRQVTDCLRWALSPAVGPEVVLINRLF